MIKNENKFDLIKSFDIVFDQAAVGMVFCNTKGKIVKVNECFAKMIGHDVEMIESSRFSSITHQDDILEDKLQFARILNGEISNFTREKRYVHKEGYDVWAQLTVTGIKNEDGEVIYLYAVIIDITESKVIQKQMKSQTYMFSLAMDKIPYKVFLKSPEGAYIACNSIYAQDLGQKPEEVVGKTDYDFFDKDLAEKYRADDYRIRMKKEPEQFVEEYRINNEKYWILTLKAPVYQGEEFIGIIGTFVDVSDKFDFDKTLLMRAESSRVEADSANEMIRMIFETSMDLMCVIDENCCFKQVNPSFNYQLGWKEEELIGYGFDKIIYKDDLDVIKDLDNTAGKKIYNKNYFRELRLISKTGPVQLFTCFIRQVGEHVVVTARNITKEREFKQYLLESKIAAEEANNAKSEFIANMSHEIRTPLNAVIGFSELLEMKLESSEYISYVHSIMTAGKSLLSLISDILDLSKIEAGMMSITNEQVVLMDLLQEIYDIFEKDAEDKGINLAVIVDGSLPDEIVIDLIRLRQILLNIVGNAVKFTDKGAVTVKARLLSQSEDKKHIDLALIVEDTGIGIPDKDLNSIFSSFKQQSTKITKDYGGTGLGLSICKKLVEMMGGTIKVESELGKGSHFIIEFSHILIGEMRKDIVKKEPLLIENKTFDNARILVVDDEELNRMLLEELLDGRCEVIKSVESGISALEIVEKEQYDLIIMDLVMPKMDGEEAAKRIRDIKGNDKVPIICFSASIGSEDHYRSMVFDDYIKKPIHINQLLQVLTKFLN